MTTPDTRIHALRLSIALALAVLPATLGGSAAATQTAEDKSIFVSAVDASGNPIKDLKAEDFAVREDGADREVVRLEPATDTLNVILLADTTEKAEPFTRDIRDALAAFVRRIHAASPDAQVSLMEFGQAALTVTPFTASTDDIEKGINRLVSKPDADSVLLEALIDANDKLARRPSPRRAVVILNIEPGNERSREDPKRIQDALRKSVAQLWAVSLQQGQLRNPTRDVVLGAMTKNTGGRREFLVASPAAVSVMESYADTLAAQYELTYRRPQSSRQPLAVQVGVRRQGVKLHASGYAPR